MRTAITLGRDWRAWAARAAEEMDARGIQHDDARTVLGDIAERGHAPGYDVMCFVWRHGLDKEHDNA